MRSPGLHEVEAIHSRIGRPIWLTLSEVLLFTLVEHRILVVGAHKLGRLLE